MTTHYDFDAMQLNVDDCIKAIKVNPRYLDNAFRWAKTPQGYDYWDKQSKEGMDLDARSTVAYFVAQSMEFQMSPFMAGMRF